MKLTVLLYFCWSCILIFVYLLWGVCECFISSSVLTVSKVCFRQMGWVRSQGEFRVPKRLMNSWTFSCVNTCVCVQRRFTVHRPWRAAGLRGSQQLHRDGPHRRDEPTNRRTNSHQSEVRTGPTRSRVQTGFQSESSHVKLWNLYFRC